MIKYLKELFEVIVYVILFSVIVKISELELGFVVVSAMLLTKLSILQRGLAK